MLLVKDPSGTIKMIFEADNDGDEVFGFGKPVNEFATTFSRAKYACKLQEMLYQQSLQNSSFCDVTLNIDNTVMKAHWAVLVVCPYFQSLYDSGMKESLSNHLTLNFGNPSAMKDAIRFLYTGEVYVTMERVRDLLEVADYLQVSEMTDICVRYLKGITLNLENCVQILLLSSQHNLETYDSILKFVCGHLPELMVGVDLLTFDKSSVLSLLTDNTLSYVKREDFFNFLVRWIEYDKDQRLKDFEELFCALDLQSVPTPVIETTIEPHPLVKQSEKCKACCQNRKVRGITGASPHAPEMRDVIIMGGGMTKDHRYRFVSFSRNMNNSLYAYFMQEERWARLPDLPYGISKPLIAITADGKVLVIDTFVGDTLEKQRQLLTYCPAENSWTSNRMTFPLEESDVRVNAFLACGNRLLMVVSSRSQRPPPKGGSEGRFGRGNDGRSRSSKTSVSAAAAAASAASDIIHHVQMMELNRETGSASVVGRFCQRFNNSEIRVSCQEVPSSLTMNGGFVYVVGTKVASINAKGNNKRKFTKFYTFDLQTNRTREVYTGGKFGNEELAYGMTDGFFTTNFGKVNHKFFNQATKKITHNRNLTIFFPLGEEGVSGVRDEYSSIAVHDEVYIFGGRLSVVQEATTGAAKYSFVTEKWTDLPAMPGPTIGAAIARGRLPVGVLRCHQDCPHCTYLPVQGGTTYNVAFGIPEECGYYDLEPSWCGSDDYYDYDHDDPSYSDDDWGSYIDPSDYGDEYVFGL